MSTAEKELRFAERLAEKPAVRSLFEHAAAELKKYLQPAGR